MHQVHDTVVIHGGMIPVGRKNGGLGGGTSDDFSCLPHTPSLLERYYLASQCGKHPEGRSGISGSAASEAGMDGSLVARRNPIGSWSSRLTFQISLVVYGLPR